MKFPIPHSQFSIPHKSRGMLLLELLVSISILAAILSVGSQAVWVSMQSGKISSESDLAIGLAGEALEATRGVVDEKWQNIYSLTKGSQHYYPALVSGRWTLVSGDEIIALNTARYTRYIVIDNVSRDLSTRMIEPIYDSANDDPSTQKVTVTVEWQGAGSPVVVSDYFFRWRNKICNQTNWAGGVGSGVKSCPDTTYESIFPVGTIDTSVGSLKLQ